MFPQKTVNLLTNKEFLEKREVVLDSLKIGTIGSKKSEIEI